MQWVNRIQADAFRSCSPEGTEKASCKVVITQAVQTSKAVITVDNKCIQPRTWFIAGAPPRLGPVIIT